MFFKPCRNITNCSYAPKCRYNHTQHPEGTKVCYECGFTSKTTHELMKHRKTVHQVPLCKEFQKGSCGFSGEDCYYSHEKNAHGRPALNVERSSTQNRTPPQGFCPPPTNPAPPLSTPQGPSQAEWLRMKDMLRQLNQMVANFQ